MAVILNIEEDHLDFFQGSGGYPSFLQAVCRARTGSGRDCHQRRYRELSGDHRSGKRRGYYFWSQPRQRLQCRAISSMTITRIRPSIFISAVRKRAPDARCGRRKHNVYNALAAIAVSLENGISMDAIRVGLAHFTGTNRRFEKKGEVKWIYHHRRLCASSA